MESNHLPDDLVSNVPASLIIEEEVDRNLFEADLVIDFVVTGGNQGKPSEIEAIVRFLDRGAWETHKKNDVIEKVFPKMASVLKEKAFGGGINDRALKALGLYEDYEYDIEDYDEEEESSYYGTIFFKKDPIHHYLSSSKSSKRGLTDRQRVLLLLKSFFEEEHSSDVLQVFSEPESKAPSASFYFIDREVFSKEEDHSAEYLFNRLQREFGIGESLKGRVSFLVVAHFPNWEENFYFKKYSIGENSVRYRVSVKAEVSAYILHLSDWYGSIYEEIPRLVEIAFWHMEITN